MTFLPYACTFINNYTLCYLYNQTLKNLFFYYCFNVIKNYSSQSLRHQYLPSMKLFRQYFLPEYSSLVILYIKKHTS